MTLDYIFSNKYLFMVMPPTESRLTVYLLVFFVVLILLPIYFKVMPSKLSKVYKRLNPSFLSVGITGLVYLFARYEGLPYFSSRAFLLLIGLVFLLWSGTVALNLYRFMPEYKVKEKIESTYNKYLPKQKKK